MIEHELIGEAIFPGTLELFFGARELLTDRVHVDVPATRFNRLVQDVPFVKGSPVEDRLATLWIQCVIDALVDRVLDRLHGSLRLGVIIRYQVIEHCKHRTFTEDLCTTQAGLRTKHLYAQPVAGDVLELHIVVCELGERHPLLQEVGVVIPEFDVLACRLHTVVHRVRDIDHAIDLTEPLDLAEASNEEAQVFEHQCGLGQATCTEISNPFVVAGNLVEHL